MARIRWRLVFMAIIVGLLPFRGTKGFAIEIYPVNKSDIKVPIALRVDMTDWQYGALIVWATVTNQSNAPFRSVRVTFAVRNRDGNYITQRDASLGFLGPWREGHLSNVRIDCRNAEPFTLEYEITGSGGE